MALLSADVYIVRLNAWYRLGKHGTRGGLKILVATLPDQKGSAWMSGSGSREKNGSTSLGSEGGLFEMLREYGCPMMDDTPYTQSDSGESFASPDGTVTAAFWLPCTLHSNPAVLPGTCVDCVLHKVYRGESAL
jgi:hypothetical protein